MNKLPIKTEPYEFWLEVCEYIERVRGEQSSFEILLAAAAAQLPENPKFAPFAHQDQQSSGKHEPY